MTPVGILLTIAGLVAAYQTAIRGPGLLAAMLAVAIAVVVRTLHMRAAKALIAAGSDAQRDPWRRSSRKERRLLARTLRLSMTTTTLTSMFPTQTLRGWRIAEGLRLA